jgi:hypothetical protein
MALQTDSLKFKLYAINIMLQSINELPIVDESDIAALTEAQIAESTLEETKMEVLSEGWDANIDYNWDFAPDTSGSIPIPSNVLSLSDAQGRYSVRDWLLYDKQNQTINIDKPISCDVIWNMEFNTLPHALRYFITVKATNTFQYRTIGDTSQYQFSREDIQDARYAALREDDNSSRRGLNSGQFATSFMRG